MFVWMAKFGAALGVRTGIHVGVDVFVKQLSPATRKPVIVFALLCGALFTGIIGTLGAIYVHELDPDEVSPELEWPSWIIYLCIPLGSYLMSFRFLQVMWRFLRTGYTPHQGHGIDYEAPHIAPVPRPPASRHDERAHRETSAGRGRAFGAAATALLIISCRSRSRCLLAARLHIIELSHSVRAELLFALLLALMATGMPISIALGLSVLTYMFILSDVDPKMVGLKLFTSIDRFEIMAIPFFILAGNFLTTGGVARRMIDFATSLIGHWYGGLGLAGVVACALFAAISGSSVATVVGIGSIILPALLQKGYPPRFGAGVIATSGALGILLPPSINLVIFAVATAGMQPRGPDGAVVDSASVGQFFIAALVPGLILATMLGRDDLVSRLAQRLSAHAAGELAECRRAFRESFWGLFLIVLVLGGIYTGLFTPTEAAAVAAVYAFVIAVFVYKGLKLCRSAGGAAQGGVDERDDPLHHHQRRGVLLAAHVGTDSAIDGGMDDRAGFRHGRVSPRDQHRAARRRQFHGPGRDRPDHGADPVPDGGGARRASGAPRHPDGGQHGSRPVPSAGRAQSLCRLRHHQDGHHRTHRRGAALARTMLVFLAMVTYIPALSLWLPRLLGML